MHGHQAGKKLLGKSLYGQGKVPVDLSDFIDDIRKEFEKLKSFLSQPNWMETAEQQNDEKEKMKKAQEII